MIVKFFEGKTITRGVATQRKLLEYPYQLLQTEGKKQMLDFLSDIEVFSLLYNDVSKYDLLTYWKVSSGSIMLLILYTK